MRLFTSTDGGASFTQTDVATMGDSYLSDRNASAAVGDDGQGVVTFVDDGGLEVADLTPIAPYVPPAPAVAPPVTVPAAGAAGRRLRPGPRAVREHLGATSGRTS